MPKQDRRKTKQISEFDEGADALAGRWRQLTIVLLGVTLALGVIVVRLLVDARNAYRNGASAEQRGEVTEAIRFYLDAGRPGCDHKDRRHTQDSGPPWNRQRSPAPHLCTPPAAG